MSLTREKAKELRGSMMWEEFVSEIDELIDSAMNEMVNGDRDKFEWWQARIKTLRDIKMLPQNVIERES